MNNAVHILYFIIGIGILALLILEFKSSISNLLNNDKRRKGSKPKSPTDYPHLPLTMETEHFGWSYELGRNGGFSYHIWSVNQKYRILVDRFKARSRTKAIERCRELEELYYPNVHKTKEDD